jgi:hypothetical protein
MASDWPKVLFWVVCVLFGAFIWWAWFGFPLQEKWAAVTTALATIAIELVISDNSKAWRNEQPRLGDAYVDVDCKYWTTTF